MIFALLIYYFYSLNSFSVSDFNTIFPHILHFFSFCVFYFKFFFLFNINFIKNNSSLLILLLLIIPFFSDIEFCQLISYKRNIFFYSHIFPFFQLIQLFILRTSYLIPYPLFSIYFSFFSVLFSDSWKITEIRKDKEKQVKWKK